MLRFSRIVACLALLTLAATSAGCASGGDGTMTRRDTGPGVTPDTGAIDAGPTDAFVSRDDTGSLPDAAMDDTGPVDAGPPPPGDERSSTALVAGGRVATSSRYRLVTSTLSLGAAAPPSSSRYVLRENIIGRIGEPAP